MTLPYITKLATLGLEGAFSEMSGFSDGLNIFKGQVTHKAVADHLKLPYVNWVSAIR